MSFIKEYKQYVFCDENNLRAFVTCHLSLKTNGVYVPRVIWDLILTIYARSTQPISSDQHILGSRLVLTEKINFTFKNDRIVRGEKVDTYSRGYGTCRTCKSCKDSADTVYHLPSVFMKSPVCKTCFHNRRTTAEVRLLIKNFRKVSTRSCSQCGYIKYNHPDDRVAWYICNSCNSELCTECMHKFNTITFHKDSYIPYLDFKPPPPPVKELPPNISFSSEQLVLGSCTTIIGIGSFAGNISMGNDASIYGTNIAAISSKFGDQLFNHLICGKDADGIINRIVCCVKCI